MGFNIDINKLTGDWRQWAETADSKGTNDKHINSIMEVDDVITQALAAGKNAQEIASVIGGGTPDGSATVSAQPDKDRAKTLKRDAFAQLEKVSFNGNWDDIASNMTASMISNTQSVESRIYYSKLAMQVRTVIDAFKGYKCDSREAIDKLEENVKNHLQIADDDEFKDFKLDLIEELVEKAETYQRQVETAKVNEKFNELRLEGKTREQALDEIKTKAESEFGFSGSYYKKIIGDMDDEVVLDDARREVWDAIEAQRGQGITDGKAIEKAVVAQLKAEGKYDKYAKKVLRGELSFGEKVKWERSLVKSFRKSVAADNRAAAAKAKHWSEDEIRGEFKHKHEAAFAGLISNEVTITATDGTRTKGTLITEKTDDEGNTYYDISNLSDLIRRRIGADLRANRQKGELSAYAEIENIRQEISAVSGVDISKREAKHLIKLCGFDVEGKNWAQVFYAAVADTLVDGIAMAGGLVGASGTATAVASYVGPMAGTAFFDYSKEIPFTVDYDNNQEWMLTINYGQGGGVNLTSLRRQLNLQKFADGTSLSDYLNIEQTDKGIVLTFKREQGGSLTVIKQINETLSKVVSLEDLGIDPNQYDIDITDVSVDIGSALAKSMLISFALNFLQEALKEHGELPITATQFNETDLEQYLAKLSKEKKITPAMFAGIRALAMSFVEMKDGKPVEGGKWNSEGFKRLLNNIAGDQSFLNKYEAAIGMYTAGKTTPEPVQEPVVVVQEPEPEPVVEYETKEEITPASKYTPGTTKFTAWQDLVNGYSCLSDPRYNVAVKSDKGNKVMLNNRMVKILQTFDLSKVPDDVDVKDVYNVDLIAEFARVCIEKGIDTALADERFKNLPVNKQKYVELLSAAGGVKGDVVIPDLYDSEGNKIEWKENGRVQITRGRGGATVTVDITTRTINGETRYYARPQGSNGVWRPITDRQYRGEDPINF